jgi:fused signal recognition particle receptor
VADNICHEIEKRLVGVNVNRLEDKEEKVEEALRIVISEILTVDRRNDLIDILEKKKEEKKPCIIVFVGINGSGKTTTIAKVTRLLLNKKYSVVLACSDTYRAGSIEQLEKHAESLGVPIIKHQYGSDAAAVAFDAVMYAEKRGINAVLVDTAGRIQTNRNLMMEIEKLVRIVKPDLVIFVGDSLMGNDAVLQAQEFDKHVEIDGSILTKVDADAKGGAAISIAKVTQKPILFLGTGQRYDDLEAFKPDFLINQILEK